MRHLEVFFLAALAVCTHSNPVIDKGDYLLVCRGALDLGIIFDVSRSIPRGDFSTVKASLAKFLSTFTVGPNAVRIGLIPFENEIHIDEGFTLDRYNNSADVAAHIHNLPHIGALVNRNPALTETRKALKYVRETMLAPEVARPGIPRVALIMTDGNSQRSRDTKREAAALRDSGVLVYAVGYGAHISMRELLSIAGDESRVKLIKNMDNMNVTLADLSVSVCEKMPKPKDPPCVNRDFLYVFSRAELGGESSQVVNLMEEMAGRVDTGAFRFGARTGQCPEDAGFAMTHDISGHIDYYRQSHLSLVVDGIFKSSPFGKGSHSEARCDVAVLVVNEAGLGGLQDNVNTLVASGAKTVFVWNMSGSDVTVSGAEVVSGSVGRSAGRVAEFVVTKLSAESES